MKLICYGGPKDDAEVLLPVPVQLYAFQAGQFEPLLMEVYAWHESPEIPPRLVYMGQEKWETPDASGH